jgi:hypothetical protein
MRLVDALAIALVLAAAIAFGLGDVALARAADARAFYWLAVGAVALRGALQLCRRGATT